MEFLIVRLADIEDRKDITNAQGQIVGANIKFKFLEDRDLIVGGDMHGTTNQTVELPAGTHTIALGPPKDFTPLMMKIVLKDTTVLSPMEVRFEKI
ncbi:MAG: hypothetical protein P8X90_34600 [Desulfobacterales bacterium]